MSHTTPRKMKQASDPFDKIADALTAAAQSDSSGPKEDNPRNTANGASNTLAHVVYNGSYALSYGLVYPALLIAAMIPAGNPITTGIIDGAQDAGAKARSIRKSPPR